MRTFFLTIFFPIVLGLIPKASKCQKSNSDLSIIFQNYLTWEEVLEKAAKENKLIILNLSASWCIPCKNMESEVLMNPKIKKTLQDSFVIIKLQIDSAKSDPENIRRWYRKANLFMRNYDINIYPSILICSANGTVLHKFTGACPLERFEQLLANISNPSSQYYTLLTEFRKGNTKGSILRNLMIAANDASDTLLSKEISNNFLEYLTDTEKFEPDNLKLIRRNIRSSKDIGFQLFLKNASKIDSILNEPGNAENLVEIIIYQERLKTYINSCIKQKCIPNWDSTYAEIRRLYNDRYADGAVAWSKVKYYENSNQWNLFSAMVVRYLENYGESINTTLLNRIAWRIFEKNSDSWILNAAAKWMRDRVIYFNEANQLDTYANILYKLGNIEEAIKFENKAIALEPNNKDFKSALDKMTTGIPTWSQE